MSEKSHLSSDVRQRAVKALLEGMPQKGVATAFDVDRTTLFRWSQRLISEGQAGLSRRAGSGRPQKRKDLSESDLYRLVLQGAMYLGYETDVWTVGRLRRVLAEAYWIELSKNTVWRRLRDAGLTYQKPEREYYEIDEASRTKWVRYEVPKIRRRVKKHRGILYLQGEANVSRTACLGKTGSPCGNTPKAKVTGRPAGAAASSAIHGKGRLLFRLVDKRIASAEVIEFLNQMLRHHPRRHLVVVMDQAPPHTSKKTRAWIALQPRLHTFYLPQYPPDWNPDEKVWNHLKNQQLASHQAKTKSELKQLARRKLQSMAKRPKLLRGPFFRCCAAELFA